MNMASNTFTTRDLWLRGRRSEQVRVCAMGKATKDNNRSQRWQWCTTSGTQTAHTTVQHVLKTINHGHHHNNTTWWWAMCGGVRHGNAPHAARATTMGCSWWCVVVWCCAMGAVCGGTGGACGCGWVCATWPAGQTRRAPCQTPAQTPRRRGRTRALPRRAHGVGLFATRCADEHLCVRWCTMASPHTVLAWHARCRGGAAPVLCAAPQACCHA